MSPKPKPIMEQLTELRDGLIHKAEECEREAKRLRNMAAGVDSAIIVLGLSQSDA